MCGLESESHNILFVFVCKVAKNIKCIDHPCLFYFGVYFSKGNPENEQ